MTFVNRGASIFYLYTDGGTVTLYDHSGQPIRANGKMFQARLDRGESGCAGALARIAW
jgi:hypothetical protein